MTHYDEMYEQQAQQNENRLGWRVDETTLEALEVDDKLYEKEWETYVESTYQQSRHDAVNHPNHYCNHPSGIECIQITEHMNFCLGNAMKYLWRSGLKEGSSALEDLRKAQWYLNHEIQRLEK
jgi:hypothetical protein